MIKEWVQQFEGDLDFEFDRLAIEVGERIVERMEELEMTRSKLATALGVSKARISQILSGDDNLTLKTLVAVSLGLESRVEFRLKDRRFLNAAAPRPQTYPVDTSKIEAYGERSSLAVAA